MMGASLILLALSCGLPAALNRLSERGAVLLAIIGIIIYAGWGFICLLMGSNFLDYTRQLAILRGVATPLHRLEHPQRNFGALGGDLVTQLIHDAERLVVHLVHQRR